jgi:preprotein translocase subunit SecG
MSVLGIFLLVLFIIVAFLMILLVLIQNEEGDSLGGVFAGGSSSAFGSRSGNILTKTTTVLGVLFFVLSFSLAVVNRTPSEDRGVENAGRSAIEVKPDDFSTFQPPEESGSSVDSEQSSDVQKNGQQE